MLQQHAGSQLHLLVPICRAADVADALQVQLLLKEKNKQQTVGRKARRYR
jgi:hypothetical protein